MQGPGQQRAVSWAGLDISEQTYCEGEVSVACMKNLNAFPMLPLAIVITPPAANREDTWATFAAGIDIFILPLCQPTHESNVTPPTTSDRPNTVISLHAVDKL